MRETANRTKSYIKTNNYSTGTTNPINKELPSITSKLKKDYNTAYLINSSMYIGLGAAAIWAFYTAMMSLMF